MSKQIIKKNGKAVLVNNKAHALLCKWSVENKQKNTDVLNAAIDLIFSTKSMKSSLLDKIFVKNTSDKIMKLNDKSPLDPHVAIYKYIIIIIRIFFIKKYTTPRGPGGPWVGHVLSKV